MQDYQQIKNYLAQVSQFYEEAEQTSHPNKFITQSPKKNILQQDLSEWTSSPKKQSQLQTEEKYENSEHYRETYIRLSLPKIQVASYIDENNLMLQTTRYKNKEFNQYKELINRLSCDALLARKKNKIQSEEYDETYTQTKVNTVLLKLPMPKYNRKKSSDSNIKNPLMNNSIEIVRKIYRKKKKQDQKTKNHNYQDEHQKIRQQKTNQIMGDINQTERWFNFIQKKQSKQKISSSKNSNFRKSFKGGRKPNTNSNNLSTSEFCLDNRKQH